MPVTRSCAAKEARLKLLNDLEAKTTMPSKVKAPKVKAIPVVPSKFKTPEAKATPLPSKNVKSTPVVPSKFKTPEAKSTPLPSKNVKSTPVVPSKFKTPDAKTTPLPSKKTPKVKSVANIKNFPDLISWKMRNNRLPVTSTPKAPSGVVVTKKDIDTCFGFDDSEEEENYSMLISPIAAPARNRLPIRVPDQSKQSKVLQNNNLQEQAIQFNVKPLTDIPKKIIKKKNAPPVELPNELYGLDVVSTQSLVDEVVVEDFPQSSFIKHEGGHDDEFNDLLVRYGKVEADDDLEVHFELAKITKTYSHKKNLYHAVPVALNKRRKLKRLSPKAKAKTVNRAHKNEANLVLDAEAKKWSENTNKEFEEVLHVPIMVSKTK